LAQLPPVVVTACAVVVLVRATACGVVVDVLDVVVLVVDDEVDNVVDVAAVLAVEDDTAATGVLAAVAVAVPDDDCAAAIEPASTTMPIALTAPATRRARRAGCGRRRRCVACCDSMGCNGRDRTSEQAWDQLRSAAMSHLRRTLLVAIAAAAACIALLPSAAGAAPPAIGPNQPFVGKVNGSEGVIAPVAIKMACFGAITPGQTGHPMAGQTVEVRRRLVDRKRFGETGSLTTSIGAFFGPPPPSASPVASYVNFTAYGLQKIPTTLTLPCAGTGHVLFVPLPTVCCGRSFNVPVTYVGQP
jgi:hypothetical protein